ncbi:MAG: MBL fold metallo-hydrolase [Natronospirillum sp.]
MRYASLGSGSMGNSTLIATASTAVMIDCGFTAKEALKRMERLEFDPADLTAVIVTHEHGDHGKGVMALCRRLNIPAYMSPGTAIGLKVQRDPRVSMINVQRTFTVGDLHIEPVAVPHDARETCQFVVRTAGVSLGVLTDLGHITPHIQTAYRAVDALILEANHDPDMLEVGPYPASLKRRVGGNFGHLSNQQSAQLLAGLDQNRLQRVVISHISEHNNDPSKAEAVLAAAMPGHERKLSLNCQDTGFGWCQIQSL